MHEGCAQSHWQSMCMVQKTGDSCLMVCGGSDNDKAKKNNQTKANAPVCSALSIFGKQSDESPPFCVLVECTLSCR